MAVDIPLQAFFSQAWQGATGLTVTVDVDKYAKADRTRTRVVTGGSATEGANGVYTYVVAGVTDAATHDYCAVFKTTAAGVDMQWVPSWQQDYISALALILAYVDVAISSRNATTPPTAAANASAVRSELVTELARVDAAISSRLAASGYTVPPTAAAIADAVLDELLSGHTTSGTPGAQLALITAGSAIRSRYDPETHALRYYYGDDYHASDGRAQDFTTTYNIAGGSVSCRVQTASGVVAIACTVLSANQYRLAPTAAQLATIGVGVWRYDFEIINSSSRVITDRQGYVTVAADVR